MYYRSTRRKTERENMKKKKKLSEEMMANNVPNMRKNINIHI